MEAADFTMPSPKRQRTNSPEETPLGESISRSDSHIPAEDNPVLDALMQHVESESQPAIPHSSTATLTKSISSAQETQEQMQPQKSLNGSTSEDAQSVEVSTGTANPPVTEHTTQPNGVDIEMAEENEVNAVEKEVRSVLEASNEEHPIDTSRNQVGKTGAIPQDIVDAAEKIDGIPPMSGAAQENKNGEGAEWEADSSPYESSSESDTSSDSSDEDSDEDGDADGDYAMLDPEEQARILMQGDAGSDDEGDGKKKGDGAGLRTFNEQLEDVPPVPEIEITEQMAVEELGQIQAVVENNVLINAKVSGEYRVLESGSLLCLQDRKIAGVVAETLGRVEQPMYTMRFKSADEIRERGIAERGTVIYYVVPHSSFVFTQPLKAVKGSDASNFHDEEVGDEEMEFSDDEAEAEHKRALKAKRKGVPLDSGRGRGGLRDHGGRGRGAHRQQTHTTDGAAYHSGSLEMNYDDVQDSEEGYHTLTRPSNLHQMMGAAQPTERSTSPYLMQGSSDRGRGRGRGGRDRGRGGRGSFRGGRGGISQHSPRPDYSPQFSPSPQFPQSPHVPSFQQNQFLQAPPPPPMLMPQNSWPQSLAASPMTPLPGQQFNFNPTYHTPQYDPNKMQTQQYPLAGGFNAPNQYYGQYAQQQGHGQGQQPNYQTNWPANQAAVAETQRQLEEMRRAGGGGS